jgi:phosphoribosylanthranilate isomerase
MMEIKICGIANLEDALCVVECGADALGFIFHPQSPRFVSPAKVREIVEALPRDIAKVGVFVNRDVREVRWIKDFCGLDFIQLHGDEPPEYCRQLPPDRLIKAVFPHEATDLKELAGYPVKAFLADARDGGRRGGTGKNTDWAAAKAIGEVMPLILAGGLNAENILEAIEAVSPLAVDLNSGVEEFPGKKDPEKVRAVIAVVRSMKKDKGVKIFGEK